MIRDSVKSRHMGCLNIVLIPSTQELSLESFQHVSRNKVEFRACEMSRTFGVFSLICSEVQSGCVRTCTSVASSAEVPLYIRGVPVRGCGFWESIRGCNFDVGHSHLYGSSYGSLSSSES